jgi:hypothetical protein
MAMSTDNALEFYYPDESDPFVIEEVIPKSKKESRPPQLLKKPIATGKRVESVRPKGSLPSAPQGVNIDALEVMDRAAGVTQALAGLSLADMRRVLDTAFAAHNLSGEVKFGRAALQHKLKSHNGGLGKDAPKRPGNDKKVREEKFPQKFYDDNRVFLEAVKTYQKDYQTAVREKFCADEVAARLKCYQAATAKVTQLKLEFRSGPPGEANAQASTSA